MIASLLKIKSRFADRVPAAGLLSAGDCSTGDCSVGDCSTGVSTFEGSFSFCEELINLHEPIKKTKTPKQKSSNLFLFIHTCQSFKYT